jgi:hypothetical protein
MRRRIPRTFMRRYESLPFFDQLQMRDQELLRRSGSELIVPPGRVVASSTDGAAQCVLLLTGAFIWSEPDVAGRLQPTRPLPSGHFLDEEALAWACAAEEGPGAFSVHASTESRILAFHRPEFTELAHQAPQIASLAALHTAAHITAWQPRPLSTLPWAQAIDEAADCANRARGVVRQDA